MRRLSVTVSLLASARGAHNVMTSTKRNYQQHPHQHKYVAPSIKQHLPHLVHVTTTITITIATSLTSLGSRSQRSSSGHRLILAHVVIVVVEGRAQICCEHVRPSFVAH